MSTAKDSKEAGKKPSSEAKRILQTDQEKQRKEKIKTCIGEIAKELPVCSDHVDRKPSTLSIVSQAKEYIKKLKEQNQAYENNLVAEQQQEELKRLREQQTEHLEKIKKLEETLKTYEKVNKPRSNDESGSAAHPDRDSPTGRRRPKTINKLLEKERSDQLLTTHSDIHHLDETLLIGSNFGHHGNSSAIGSGSNNSSTLPPSSLVLPMPSSGISIMTVAPTILSVKSPSLGQTRNQQTSRSISTASVVGSGTSSRISSSAASSLVSYLDVMGGDFSDGVNGIGSSVIDSSQTNLVYSTSSMSASSSVLAAGGGSVVNTADIMGLQQLQNNSVAGGNSGGGGGNSLIGGIQNAELSLIHHHQQQQQQQNMAPLLNISQQQQEGPGSASALQTLASVATSSHMAGLGSVSLANSQQVGAQGPVMGLSMGLGGGLSAMPLGQLQGPNMSLAQSELGAALAQQDRKQVFFNGQILTLTDHGLISSHQQGDTECQNSLQASICPQSSLPMGAGSSLHQGGINVGGILGQGNFSGAHIGSGPLTAATGPGQPSIIYTINEHGHLVPLQTPMNHIQPGPSGLDFMTGAGGGIMTNFQNPSAGNAALIPSSVQHQQQSSFLAQPPIMSIAGGHGSSQPFTILPPNPGNSLQPQVISAGGSFLMAQQFPQQQQVLNLAGLGGGLQVVNPFTGMLVNNLGTTLSGATVKLVGNELKIIQPGDSSGAQGPTHVMVDGSLIPISTNPQTIVPSPASISTIGQKTQPVSLAGNPILQFDPINPNAPPILFNGPATCPQMGPQMLGPGPLYSPALTGAPGILHMASGGPLGSSIPFQLGSNSGVAVASTMVAGTVTTNSVSACISSPSVSTATKGGKGLPTLAPALSQASPVIGSSVANSYQTILPSGLPQQFVINGQKVVSSKIPAASAVIPKPASHNRKRSPSTARASPIVASDVAVSQYVQQQQHLLPAATAAVVQTSVKYATGTEKASKSKSSKHGGLQQQEDKRVAGHNQKTDLLAQATATAGILMDGEAGNSDYSHQANSTGESGNLNISTGSNANLSGSSTELQINLKQSPRDEEDDNVQLIIDENCVSGVSSTSPAHSSFSPNMMLSSALSAGNTSSSVFSHDMSLSSSTAQHLHIQPPNGDLTTPLVSPNIPSMAGVSAQNQRQATTGAMLNMASQLHSPLPSNIFSTSSTSGMLNPSANSELQIVAGPFRAEDVFAQLSGAMSTDSKINISPDSSNKLNTLTSFNVSTSVPLSLTSTSPVPKLYIPIAPAPVKVSAISTPMSLAHDAPAFSFTDSVVSATVLSDKQTSKGKCRSKKQTPLPVSVASLQLKNMDVSMCGLQAFQPEPKKKPPPRKRKTKAELKLEKEEKERLAKEEVVKKEENEFQDKKLQEMEHKVKQNNCSRGVDDDSLLPVLEMNDNEAVKEQILHSVSESKLLNTDGSQISLMDMVDKIEIFNSAVGNSDVFCSSGATSEIPVEGVKLNKLSTMLPDKVEQDKSVKRESTRKRKTDPCGNNAPKVDNKRTKKPKAMEPLKSVDGVLFNVNSGVSGSSDIYDFVDDEDGGNQFIQPPATPTKLTNRKPPVSRKGKGSKPTPDSPLLTEVRPSCSVAARGEIKPASRTVNPGRQLMEPTLDHVTLSKLSTVVAASAALSTSVALSSPSSSSSLLTMPKSPLFSSTPGKPSPGSLTTSNSITISNTACAIDNNRTVGTVINANTSTSCMSKKDGPDVALQSTLEESFSIEFPVMDFQTSPKLSETQDDHENSMGLPAETLADLFTQHSPGKIMLTSSPPLLQNGVLSPSDVELPALRTPAPLMNHNHSEPVLLLDNHVNKDLMSPSSSSSAKQTVSHMHTPPHPDPKSPVITLVDITTGSSSSSSTSLSLTTTESSMPPLSVSLSMSSGNTVGSCINSSTPLHHHLDPAVSPRSASQLDSQMPSLSSSSLDALSEILPLKPITAELEAEDSLNSSCAQQQRRSTPVQGHSLSHGALTSADVGMGVSQQQQQQSMMSDLQQKSQQSRQNQPHHPPQSSPHNLRPPSASTTPLPSPKLHASPGSASNAGSVHSMSPAAQQQQQHLSCQKQQQNSQMGSASMMDRVSTAPLSHPSSQTQLFNPPDTSPRNTTFTSPPSGSSMKLKHMSPSNSQPNSEQNFGSQKGGSFPPGTGQQTKNQYSVDKIIEHPNNGSAGVPARHPGDSFNFTNIGSNVATSTSAPSSGPLTSNPGGSGFTFSLSATNQQQHQQQQQQSSCSANSSAVSSLQPTLPTVGAHTSHNSPYLNSFFPPPLPMNPPSASTSSSHHSLSMHPQGNMEIQHTTSRPSSGGSSTSAYGMGTSSLMTYGNQPKLDIPPIAKSPTYNTNNPSSNNSSTNNASNNSVSAGKSPSSGSGSGVSGSYSHTSSKQAIDSSASRYQASKSTAESIYQQQQKRPNTIQHPPAGMSHMDSMARLSSSAHNNSFFTMGFPASSTASLSSASMPLRHLPDTRDISSRSPYDYAPVPHHPAMGFPHPHSQIASGYGTHASFARDCARLESSHHQTQQQAQQHPQQQQQSPRKQTTPKKSSSSASIGSSANAASSNSGNNSSNASSHRGSGSSGSGTGGSSSLNQDHGHSPAASSSRTTPAQHHSSQQQNAGSGSTNSSSHNRSSNSQKRKAASSSSSSKKKSTASQHTGFPMDPMDTSMSQNMFEPSFPYLNFPTLAQSMSPPAARPHQADTPFLSGMFNTQPRPISNSSAKTADMTASHFPLFSARAQNSFFQPTGFGMNSVTGNHGNPTAGISPHSMAVPPHMSAFGLFGNEATGAPDNISSNKFLHTNSILPGGHQAMDHSLQHGHQASLYHTRPHSAQSHMMAAFYPHGFDTRGHMGQPFNSSMGPPPFHTSGLPPINFSMHDSH